MWSRYEQEYGVFFFLTLCICWRNEEYMASARDRRRQQGYGGNVISSTCYAIILTRSTQPNLHTANLCDVRACNDVTLLSRLNYLHSRFYCQLPACFCRPHLLPISNSSHAINRPTVHYRLVIRSTVETVSRLNDDVVIVAAQPLQEFTRFTR